MSRANPKIEIALVVAAAFLGTIALVVQFRVGPEWQPEAAFLGFTSVLLFVGVSRRRLDREQALEQGAFLPFVETVSLLALALAAFLTLLAVVCLFMIPASRGSLRYFPGDPPCADLALTASSLALASCAVAFLGTRWARGSGILQETRLPLALVSITVSGCLLISGGSVLYRFSPTWKPIRQGIRHHGEAILSASGGDANQVIHGEEFDRLREEYFPYRIEVDLAGFGPVHLRMAHGVDPFIAVDFGEGRNAAFDPDTMICIYSD